jgi:uncharacterized protein (DUF1501 family)
MKRRDFLTLLTGAAVLAIANPSVGKSTRGRKTLLVVELAGGNDGLNTFIPYRDANYLKLRPNLGIKDGLPVSNAVALHPGLKDLKPILERGRLAIVQNVSYPNPSLSHFRSKDIWQSGNPQGVAETGWLARYLDVIRAETKDAIFLGEEYPLALTGTRDRFLQLSPRLLVNRRGHLGTAIQALYATPQAFPLAEEVRRTVLESQQAIRQLTADLGQRSAHHGYAKTAIGQQFALAGKILESRPAVLYLAIGGWDTHAGQAKRQQNLLEQLGAGLAALDRDLQARGLEKDVLVMVHSEFGRRAAENGSGGTDHGTAGAVVLLGQVRSGFYGGNPGLDSLVNGNLPMQVDFRSIYAEILNRWAAIAAQQVLEHDFPKVGFLA